jgi:hypothetical protein
MLFFPRYQISLPNIVYQRDRRVWKCIPCPCVLSRSNCTCSATLFCIFSGFSIILQRGNSDLSITRTRIQPQLPKMWRAAHAQRELRFTFRSPDNSAGWLDVEVSLRSGQQKLNMKNVVFRDVAPSGSCKNRRFGGNYRLRLQGRKILVRIKAFLRSRFFFYTDDGADELLWNFGFYKIQETAFFMVTAVRTSAT